VWDTSTPSTALLTKCLLFDDDLQYEVIVTETGVCWKDLLFFLLSFFLSYFLSYFLLFLRLAMLSFTSQTQYHIHPHAPSIQIVSSTGESQAKKRHTGDNGDLLAAVDKKDTKNRSSDKYEDEEMLPLILSSHFIIIIIICKRTSLTCRKQLSRKKTAEAGKKPPMPLSDEEAKDAAKSLATQTPSV
jgi:hypothetical protein